MLEKDDTLFIKACSECNLEEVKKIVSEPINTRFMSNRSANQNYFISLFQKNIFDKQHLEIVKYLISQGANGNLGLYYACKFNDLELAKKSRSFSANDFGFGLKLACHFGNLELAKFCKTPYSDSEKSTLLSGGFPFSGTSGSTSNGATNFDEGFLEACKTGHLDLAKFCISSMKYTNGDIFDKGLLLACECGYPEIAKFCKDYGAVDYSHGLIKASEKGNLELAEFCINSANQLHNESIRTCRINHLKLYGKF